MQPCAAVSLAGALVLLGVSFWVPFAGSVYMKEQLCAGRPACTPFGRSSVCDLVTPVFTVALLSNSVATVCTVLGALSRNRVPVSPLRVLNVVALISSAAPESSW